MIIYNDICFQKLPIKNMICYKSIFKNVKQRLSGGGGGGILVFVLRTPLPVKCLLLLEDFVLIISLSNIMMLVVSQFFVLLVISMEVISSDL